MENSITEFADTLIHSAMFTIEDNGMVFQVCPAHAPGAFYTEQCYGKWYVQPVGSHRSAFVYCRPLAVYSRALRHDQWRDMPLIQYSCKVGEAKDFGFGFIKTNSRTVPAKTPMHRTYRALIIVQDTFSEALEEAIRVLQLPEEQYACMGIRN